MAGLSRNEGLKEKSNFLRGTIKEGLERTITGALAEEDTQLTKFHGFYQQDDRDLRPERRKKMLEPAYSFMLRVRIPGGVLQPDQWLGLDRIAGDFSNGTIRLTTRQAIQFHGVIKSNLKRTMQSINASVLDTLAACGDVNRNVMSAANPYESAAHAAAAELAAKLGQYLLPKTGAYHEIWLDGEKVVDASGTATGEEPIYGRTYLPRKFKTVVAVPPVNDVDIFAHDLGFAAVRGEGGVIVGWNVTVGGGMGMTHGEHDTFPRTADYLGFCTTDQVIDVAREVLTVQRDWGNREDRKRARLKYTIETHGLDAFRAEVERRVGFALKEARPIVFEKTGDRYGWTKGDDGRWHFCLYVENGRVKDLPGRALRTGLRKIAETHDGRLILTPNQNLVIAGVKQRSKKAIDDLLKKHGLDNEGLTGLRLNAMACVALPSCALALAESERYLPDLVTALDDIVEEAGLRDDEIVIRMTGCPNGCARPYLAEIGLVGKGPGSYNLYLGASFDGARMNKLYKADLAHESIVSELRPLILAYAREREKGERFGDFVIRKGFVAPTLSGNTFHDNVAA